MPGTHAKLSPSSSARWLNCPGSVAAEAALPPDNDDNPYAREGSCAHEVADKALSNFKDVHYYIGEEHFGFTVTNEMAEYTQQYVDYVRSFETADTILWSESRVDFSKWVPNGFGTCDAAIFDPVSKTLHVFDLKYGMGELVVAHNNTQAQMYALGFADELDFLGDIESVNMHICQPRKQSFTSWEITIGELYDFAVYVSERAKATTDPKAPRIPGEKQCRWCRVAGTCDQLAEFTRELLGKDFDDLNDPDDLTTERIVKVIENEKLINKFLESVKELAHEKAEANELPGYKLVEGRSVRRWTENAEPFLIGELGDDAFSKKLIGIAAAEIILGKGEVSDYTSKPPGKPTLAPVSDRRPAIETSSVVDDFEELEG